MPLIAARRADVHEQAIRPGHRRVFEGSVKPVGYMGVRFVAHTQRQVLTLGASGVGAEGTVAGVFALAAYFLQAVQALAELGELRVMPDAVGEFPVNLTSILTAGRGACDETGGADVAQHAVGEQGGNQHGLPRLFRRADSDSPEPQPTVRAFPAEERFYHPVTLPRK